MIRVAIVNDLRLAVEVLKRAVATIPGASVAWIAEDGAQAVAKCSEDRPDIVLMDMIMPVMDGVEATRRIMKATPCPILVVTATVEGNASKVYEALGAGALDAVATPRVAPDGSVVNAESLASKVRTITLLAGVGSASQRSTPPPASFASRVTRQTPPILAIGSSTGGPLALSVILKAIPAPAQWPIVVVQHVGAEFAPGLATWLSAESGHRVEIAVAGDTPRSGSVSLAATGDHLVLSRDGTLRYSVEPRDMVYRPSVDVFFESLAAVSAAPGVVVVLTGMGRDGASGMLRLRAAGWQTIAQDKATSVVWGMPGACVELGAAMQTLPVVEIGGRILQQMAAKISGSARASSARDWQGNP